MELNTKKGCTATTNPDTQSNVDSMSLKLNIKIISCTIYSYRGKIGINLK